MIWTIPNIMTFSRIALLPVIVWMLFVGGEGTMSTWGAFGLYVVTALTDFFDGYFARKLNQYSDLGRCLDPISDKLLILLLFVTLIAVDRLHTPLQVGCVLIILFREILMSGLREFISSKGFTIHVTGLAKWKTTVQMIALGGFLLVHPLGDTLGVYTLDVYNLSTYILYLATALTAITGYQYFVGSLKFFKS